LPQAQDTRCRGAFTVREFCDWARIGHSKFYGLVKSGELPIVKIGGKTLIRVSDGKALLDKNVRAAEALLREGA
jgi:excisionase family DNA binding protein